MLQSIDLQIGIIENQIMDYQLISDAFSRLRFTCNNVIVKPNILNGEERFRSILSLTKLALDDRYEEQYEAINGLCEQFEGADVLVVDHRLLGYSTSRNLRTHPSGISLIHSLIKHDNTISRKQIIFLSRSSSDSEMVLYPMDDLEKLLERDEFDDAKKPKWVYKSWKGDDQQIGSLDYFRQFVEPVLRRSAEEKLALHHQDQNESTVADKLIELKAKAMQKLGEVNGRFELVVHSPRDLDPLSRLIDECRKIVALSKDPKELDSILQILEKLNVKQPISDNVDWARLEFSDKGINL